MDDIPISAVTNTPTGSRAVTPIKAQNRQIRPTSAPRTFRLTTSLVDPNRPISSSRHISRRRVRRFENSNLFGLGVEVIEAGIEFGDPIEDPG